MAGLPTDRAGFVPVDLHGRVTGEPCVYAAGEVTSFPLRQGGLAAQQADVVAETIAARYAGGPEPAPFAPVLRARLTTSGAPLYLQAGPPGQSLASHRAMWSPPEKVAGRYLAPYLADRAARPHRRRAARPSACRPLAAAPGGERAAVTLALTLAAAEDALPQPQPRAAGARRGARARSRPRRSRCTWSCARAWPRRFPPRAAHRARDGTRRPSRAVAARRSGCRS